MPGAFDDLIPGVQAPTPAFQPTGAFDDLVPKSGFFSALKSGYYNAMAGRQLNPDRLAMSEAAKSETIPLPFGLDPAPTPGENIASNLLKARSSYTPSEQLTRINKQVDSGDYSGGAKTLINNPMSILPGIAGQSIPNTIPGLALAASTGGGSLAAKMAGMGLGSYLIDSKSTTLDDLRKRGVDMTDPAAIDAALGNKELMGKATVAGARHGLPVGVLDAFSLGLAGKTLSPLFKSGVARQAVNIPAQVGSQGILGGLGEGIGQKFRSGKITSKSDILAEMLGEIAMAPAETVTARYGTSDQNDIANKLKDALAQKANVGAGFDNFSSNNGYTGEGVNQQPKAPPEAPVKTTDAIGDFTNAIGETGKPVAGAFDDLIPAEANKSDSKPVQPPDTTNNDNVQPDAAQPATGETMASKLASAIDNEENPGIKAVLQRELDSLQANQVSGQFGQLPNENTNQQKNEAVIPPEQKTDRRKNPAVRAIIDKFASDMTPDELRTTVRTNDLTGINNLRAYAEDTAVREDGTSLNKLPVQVSMDVDGLKWVNDNMGHVKGDVLLKEVAAAVASTTKNSYHRPGDEFIIQANSEEEAHAFMAKARAILENKQVRAVIEKPDGTMETLTLPSIQFSYGIGKTYEQADTNQRADKKRRLTEGKRVPRGDEPQGVLRERVKEGQDSRYKTGDKGEAVDIKRTVDSLERVVSGDSVPLKSTIDGGLSSKADLVTDLIERKPLLSETNRPVEKPSFSETAKVPVQSKVVGPLDNEKVSQPVVSPDLVDMVDVEAGGNLSAKEFLHNQNMGGDISVSPVAIDNEPPSIEPNVTGVGTEVVGVSRNKVGLPDDGGPAVVTRKSDRIKRGHIVPPTGNVSSGVEVVASTPLTLAQKKAVSKLQRTVDKFGFATPSKVVNSPQDLPVKNAPANTKGLFHNGEVYLVKSNIKDNADALTVAVHEKIGHQGTRAFLKSQGIGLSTTLDAIYRDNSVEVKKVASVRDDLSTDTIENQRIATEEYIADQAEFYLARPNMPLPAWLNKLLVQLKNVLRKAGATTKEWGKAELLDLLTSAKRISEKSQATQDKAVVDGARYSRTAADTAPDQQESYDMPKEDRTWWAKNVANPIIDKIDTLVDGTIIDPRKATALGRLGDVTTFKLTRYKAMGEISRADDVAAQFTKAFKDKKYKEAVFNYLTAGGSLESITDASVRNSAKEAKKLIQSIGLEAVRRGWLPSAVYEENKDTYLPRVYLKYLIEKKYGTGGKSLDKGWLKARKDIPQDVREIILGEITDPAFLVARAITVPMHDFAVADYLTDIAKHGKEWVWTQSYINITTGKDAKGNLRIGMADKGGKRVTSAWLDSESKRLEKQIKYMKENKQNAARKVVQDLRDLMHEADTRLAENNPDPSKFRQLPNSSKYGELMGMYVRKEIYNDLVGTKGGAGAFNDDLNTVRVFWKGMETWTAVWKGSKVALNPPSQFRNAMSNVILLNMSGMPLAEIPIYLYKAVRQINADSGTAWSVAKEYGVKQGTFYSNEMKLAENALKKAAQSSNPLRGLMSAFATIYETAGGVYGMMEQLGKTAKIMYEMDNGADAGTAAIAAHETLFDYSLVNPSTKIVRSSPIGIPFATFYSKMLARTPIMALKHPVKFALWSVGLDMATKALMMSLYDVGDDDVDRLKKDLPGWIRAKGHAFIFPLRDSSGRWVAMDFSYLLPWATPESFARNALSGNIDEMLQETGLFGAPLSNMIAVILTNKDPFTKREIVKNGDPAAKQIISIMTYLWNMNAPTFINTDLNNFGGGSGTLSRIYQAASGKVSTSRLDYGEEKASLPQALARIIGINLYPIDPEVSRKKNIMQMNRGIRDTRRRMIRELRRLQPGSPDEERNKLKDTYLAEINLRIKQREDYMDASEINPNLKRKK